MVEPYPLLFPDLPSPDLPDFPGYKVPGVSPPSRRQGWLQQGALTQEPSAGPNQAGKNASSLAHGRSGRLTADHESRGLFVLAEPGHPTEQTRIHITHSVFHIFVCACVIIFAMPVQNQLATDKTFITDLAELVGVACTVGGPI